MVLTFFKQIGHLLNVVRKHLISSCYEHTLELLQVRVTFFAEVFGMSVVASDQYASLKLHDLKTNKTTTY